jgi:hypothetical protein
VAVVGREIGWLDKTLPQNPKPQHMRLGAHTRTCSDVILLLSEEAYRLNSSGVF